MLALSCSSAFLFFPNTINSFTVDYHRLTSQHSKKDTRTGIYNENCTILVLFPPLNFKLLYYGSLPLEGVRASNDTSSKIAKITLSKLSHLMANMSKMTENHFFKILPFTVQNVENHFFKNQWKKHQNRQIRVLRT